MWLNVRKSSKHKKGAPMEKENPAKHKYANIVMDVPWPVNQRGKRGAIMHYNLMTLEEIAKLPIDYLSTENAVCWFWVTNSTIDIGYEMLRGYGFRPVSILTWFKFKAGQLGLGNYLRNDTEHVLLGVKGKMPIAVHNQPSWFLAPTAEHSRKPAEFFAIAERCYPQGPKLELFARRRQPGWDVWGNEIESDIVIPGYPVPKYTEGVI
jgi:N6-adenosine-specific RNA methylase IME4